MRRDFAWTSAIAGLAVASAGTPLIADAGTVSYVYDGQGRIACASYQDGTLLEYAYDVAGNRTTYVVTSGASCPALPPNPPPPPPPPPPPSVHVSPNPGWTPVTGHANTGTPSINVCDTAKTLPGITLPVTLQFTGVGSVKYSKNGGAQTALTNGATLSMSPTDNLLFCVTQTGNGETSGTMTVTNQTDFNAVIGTVTYDVYIGAPI